MFDFQSDIDQKKAISVKEVNPVLYSTLNEAQVYYVIDHPLPSVILTKLIKFISNMNKGQEFKIISALPFEPQEKDLEKSIVAFYIKYGTDLKKYIPEWSNVVTIGRAIYDVIKSDDLDIEGFYDTVLWKTSFFAPEIKSTVYPCPNQFLWLEKDTFERFFTLKQMSFAQKPTTKLRIAKPNLIALQTKEEIDAFLDKWMSYSGVTAFDTETKGLDPWAKIGKIICLTLAFDSEKNTAYYLPFHLIDKETLEKLFSNKKLVGNNTKYDFRWLRVKAKINKKCLHLHWDNMQGSHAINELQYNSLKSDAWIYTPYGGYDLPLALYQEKYPACKEDYSLIPFEVLFPYATMDALVSLECYRKQQVEIDELDAKCKIENGWSIRHALTEVTFPAVEMFADIEINGMYYDWDKLKILSDELNADIDKRRKALYELLKIPEDINIDSGDQLGKFLESIGWENPGRSKKGLYLTNEASMIYWKSKGHKEVDAINDYTEATTIMKTFVGVEKNEKGNPTGYWQYRKSDNLLHGNFSVCMADTWRGKSYDPNLQNIVKNSTIYLGSKEITDIEKYRKSDNKIKIVRNGELLDIVSNEILESDRIAIPLHVRVRECFCIPSDDFVISENDGCGLQLRIAATMSGDEVMKDVFCNRGGDMHSMTGQKVFCPDVPLEVFIKNKGVKPYKNWRKKAKGINFGLIFGESARAFASSSLQKEWSIKEAHEYVTDYKLEERQQKLYQSLLKNIDKEKPSDKKVWLQDQLDFSYYWASAEDIRSKFFKTYPTLEKWISNQAVQGKLHGYVQSLWGPIRRTPFLTYVGHNDDGARVKNYQNICANSPVQNWEVFYILSNMSESNKEFTEKKLKTYLIGNIHDSFIDYMHRSEFTLVKDIYVSHFHKVVPEVMKGIPYEVEFSFCDYTKGQYWGVEEQNF